MIYLAEPDLTDWISGDLKPVRDGVYLRRILCGFIVFSLFKNGLWYHYAMDAESAAMSDSVSFSQCEEWRGLASEPQNKLDVMTKADPRLLQLAKQQSDIKL